MKLAIFDLDDTLIIEGRDPPHIHKQSYDVLEYYEKKGYTLCVATLNEYGHEICMETDLKNYIDSVVAKRTRDDKLYHFSTLLKHYRCKPKDCVFFDDLKCNVECARSLGIKSALVYWKRGITMNDIKKLKI